MLPCLKGEVHEHPGSAFSCISGDGNIMATRVQGRIESCVKFPPRQKPASFSLDTVMRELEAAGSGCGN
jgi:hypothetical protein